MIERALAFAEFGVNALNQIIVLIADHNAIMREQNAQLERIAAAAEESARNNPLAQMERIMAGAGNSPEDTIR